LLSKISRPKKYDEDYLVVNSTYGDRTITRPLVIFNSSREILPDESFENKDYKTGKSLSVNNFFYSFNPRNNSSSYLIIKLRILR